MTSEGFTIPGGLPYFWQDWTTLDSMRFTSSPAVATWGAGNLHLFCRGLKQQLLYKRMVDGAWQDGWQDLGGNIQSNVSVVALHPGRLDVFACGSDFALMQKSFENGVWGDWKAVLIPQEPILAEGMNSQLPALWSPVERPLYLDKSLPEFCMVASSPQHFDLFIRQPIPRFLISEAAYRTGNDIYLQYTWSSGRWNPAYSGESPWASPHFAGVILSAAVIEQPSIAPNDGARENPRCQPAAACISNDPTVHTLAAEAGRKEFTIPIAVFGGGQPKRFLTCSEWHGGVIVGSGAYPDTRDWGEEQNLRLENGYGLAAVYHPPESFHIFAATRTGEIFHRRYATGSLARSLTLAHGGLWQWEDLGTRIERNVRLDLPVPGGKGHNIRLNIPQRTLGLSDQGIAAAYTPGLGEALHVFTLSTESTMLYKTGRFGPPDNGGPWNVR
jgi:hypothetical protein